MKRNAEKLTAFLIIAAMTMFITGAIASANDHDWKRTIQGQYAVTGFSSCDPASPGIMEAIYTFRHDGTGSATGDGRRISASGESSDSFQLDFHYTVTEEGRIEFQYPFPPGGIRVGYYDENEVFHVVMTMDGAMSHGYISPDGKTITIQCGPPKYLTAIDPETGNSVFGPVWCITSVAGMRIK
jgi:hypothetical protein